MTAHSDPSDMETTLSPYEQAEEMADGIEAAKDVSDTVIQGDEDDDTVFLQVLNGNRDRLESIVDDFLRKQDDWSLFEHPSQVRLIIEISD